MSNVGKVGRIIFVEVNPDTDTIIQIHWHRNSVIEKYSEGTLSRIERVVNRYTMNTGTLVKNCLWAKIKYRKGITFYEVEKRAIDQTRDLKLRFLFLKLANRNIKEDIDKAHIEDFIQKIKIYFNNIE